MINVTLTFKGPGKAFQAFHRQVERRVLPQSARLLARTTRRHVLLHTPVLTGELRDSIDIAKFDDTHYAVFAAAPHSTVVEFGFQGIQIVREHQRLQTHAFGRPILARQVQVSSHTRFVNRAPNPYMRPGLVHAENRAVPILVQQLRRIT